MKKKIILLFLFVLASFSGWAQYSVSFSTPVTGGVIGSSIQVDFVYSAPAPCNIYAGIGLQNADWSPVSFVGGNGAPGNPLPAGTNLTGTLYITIPPGTTPTADLTGGQNYKINIAISDASWVWQAGDYPATELNFTAPTAPPVTPAISFTSVPTTTEIGTVLTVNYKYTAPAAGNIYCSINLYDDSTWISFVGGQGLVPAPPGTDVTGSFNILIPSGTTPTASLTGLQNYKIKIELSDSSWTVIAGDYPATPLNFTAPGSPVAPAITFNPVITSSQVGSTLVVNYKYTSSVPVNIYAGVNKFIDNVYDSSIPGGNSGGVLPAGTDLTGSISFPIPGGTVPTNGTNPHYKLTIQLSDSSWAWLAEQTENITLTAAPAVTPSISFTSVPTTTEIGTVLTVNYKYTAAADGNIFCGINLLNDWTFVSYVGGQGLSPAPAGTDVTGSFNILIPSGTTPTASLTGLQNYKINIVLSDSSWVTLAGDYPATLLNFTAAPTYTYYADADADGYGAGAAILLTSSTAPTGYSVNNTDCDDSNPAINPAATEIFDTIDNDCDGLVDEGTTLGAPVVANIGICKGTVGATPSATALPGYTLVWYKDATTTTALPAAPVITATKTYYVAQKLGAGTPGPRISVTTTVNPLPTTPSPLVLTNGSEVIKKAGNFIGTSTPLTLTATAAGTVPTDHYNWTLPTDVAQVSGGSTGVITVNFAAVAPGNTSLDFFVSSVSAEGCVSKTAKKLTVTRSEPGKPKKLTLTDGDLPEVLKITKLDTYTGALKERILTLTATPETKAGSQASSYKWVLPAGVTTTADADSDPLTTNTYVSTLPTIAITLAGVTNETSFLFQVYGVNGNGESLLSKDLTCTSAAPKTPGAITTPLLTKPTYNTTCNNMVTVQVPSALGATYAWSVDGGASISSGQGTNSIVINTAAASATLTISVTASNGTGTSLPKVLLLKKATSCAKIAAEEVIAADEFNVIAYPNPSSSEFTIDVQSSSKGAANVQVYDMVGRLIENRQVQSNSVQVGSRLASGVYNVIVNQGTKMKTLRVIKK